MTQGVGPYYDTGSMNLLSTVYSQCWPAPDSSKRGHLRAFHGGKLPQRQSSATSRASRMSQPMIGGTWAKYGQTVSPPPGRGHHPPAPRDGSPRLHSLPSRCAGVDEATYKWKTWTSYRQDCENDPHDLTMYKITQDTFHKLSKQVREINQQINKCHSNSFRGDGQGAVVHPSQLAANLPHQPPSISVAAGAYSLDAGEALQCRPVQKSSRRRRNSSATSRRNRPHPPQEPHSSASKFDQLTPRMIGALSDAQQTGADAAHPGPFDIVAYDAKPGVADSGDSEDGDEDVDEAPRVYRVRTPPSFDLPAEDLDIHDRRGRFAHRGTSASKAKKQEPYPEALSAPFCYLDLLELSLLKEDWRHAVRAMPDGLEGKLIDRLIEMERLQAASAEWEKGPRTPTPSQRRATSATQVRKGWNASAAIPTERAQSALARPRQSRNCSPGCLRTVCAGDCPGLKQEPSPSSNAAGCLRCKQEHCRGECTEFGYHLHIRQPREEEEGAGEGSLSAAKPKPCRACTPGRSPSRKSTINSNAAVLGRPKSAFATFSSARQQTRKARPISAVTASGVGDSMARLELSSPTGGGGGDRPPRPRTATAAVGATSSRPKSRGRDGQLPGKSFTSQRRHSLTEEPVSTSATKMNPKHIRAKSARMRSRHKKSGKR